MNKSSLTSNSIKYIIAFKQRGSAVSDLVPISKETLTPAQFAQLADVPPELEWLGHSTLEMTRRYANLVTADLQEVHERLSLLRA